MASILGVETLQHTNGTTAATIKSDGTFYPTGGIVQVKQGIITTGRQQLAGTTEAAITGATVSITPKSTSSKILFMSAIPSIAYNPTTIRLALYRDSTEITELGHYSDGNNWSPFVVAFQFLDNPSTASAVTYSLKAQLGNSSDPNGVYFNYANANSAGFSTHNDSRGTVTVMEIAG